MRYNDCVACGREMSQSETSPCHDCTIAEIASERDFNAASLRDANAEIARLRAEVERLTRERDEARGGQMSERCALEGAIKEIKKLRAEVEGLCDQLTEARDRLKCAASECNGSGIHTTEGPYCGGMNFPCPRACDEDRTALAEVERLTKERDEAVCSLDRVCRDVLVTLAGYVGTPAEGYRKAGLNWIAADIEEARKKGESAEARVAELEAACAREARLSEFWREKTRERVAGMELRGAVAAVVVEMRSTGGGGASCKNVYGWADRLDSALLSPKPAPCGTCGDAGSGGWPCEDCGAGMPPKTAPKCGKCGGSGQVAVMRVEIVRDENGEPGGEWVGDSEPCPDCRGGGK